MTRLAAVEKMQFYPTSAADIYQICKRLVATGNIRLLDPCSGKGTALAELHAHLKSSAKSVTSYAVELDVNRFEQCLLRFPNTTLNSDWFQVVSSNEAVSLLFDNPPYDTEVVASDEDSNKKMRLEWNFLRNAENKLQAGGVHVLIVPQLIFANKRCASHLAAWYDNINIYSVVPGETDKFNQVIFFGVMRAKRQEPDEETVAMILKTGEVRPISIDTAPIVTYTVPPMRVPADKYTFRKTVITRADTLALVGAVGAQTTAEYKKLDHPNKELEFVPVTPLKAGHVAAMVSSGSTPVMNLGSLIMRGMSGKTEIVKDAQGNILEDGRADPHSKKATQTFVSDLYVMHANGEYEQINNDPKRFQALMEEHGQRMHEIITNRYKPLYEGPTDAEWKQTALYMHGKKLPGRKSTGLLPMQRHVVIAGMRTLLAHKHVNFVCDMGTGKTSMSLATIDMLPNAWPAIVFGPGHMVEKWKAEIPKVVPGAKGFIARSVADVTKFVRDWRPGDKWVLIMGYEMAKMGAGPVAIGNRPGCRRIHSIPNLDEHGNVLSVRHKLRPCCPKCGNFVTLRGDDQAVKCSAVMRKITRPDGSIKDILCNEPLYQKTRYHRWQLADLIHKQFPGFFKTLICDEVHKAKGKDTDIARAFHQLTMATRYTINLTGTLFGGKSKDLFFMLYRLMKEVRANFDFNGETKWSEVYGRLERTLVHTKKEDDRTRHQSGAKVKALDATEKPGISPRIYQLLLKTTIMLRIQDLGYKLPPYQETVVTLDMSEMQKAQYDWFESELYGEIMDGLTSFDSDLMKRANQLLSVWLTEARLRPNAGFRSQPIVWVPPHDKGEKGQHEPWLIPEGTSEGYGYSEADDEEAIANGVIAIPLPPGDRRGHIVVDENIEGDGDEAMLLYPVCKPDELLPKEEWLLQFCLHEKQQGRKTIVGIEQTAVRDIQPRIVSILARHGIKAVVLPDELKNTKREAWIAQRAPFIDVLITNPRKVETGLDLIQFANLVVYELTTSLFTLAQFVKRVWRLGQTQPVKTYYLVYRDTMEHRMLGLMAQKVMAAALLYGDNASSAMSAETDEEDLLAALAKAALNKLPITSGIEAVLASMMQQDESIEMVDDVDAADLAAMFDAEEREDEQAAFDDIGADEKESGPKNPPIIGFNDDDDDGRAPQWWTWQDLAKLASPKKKKKPAAADQPIEQLDFFMLAALAATGAEPKPKSQPSIMVAANTRSGSAAAQQAMLF